MKQDNRKYLVAGGDGRQLAEFGRLDDRHRRKIDLVCDVVSHSRLLVVFCCNIRIGDVGRALTTMSSLMPNFSRSAAFFCISRSAAQSNARRCVVHLAAQLTSTKQFACR
jgi:hypothetical protein